MRLYNNHNRNTVMYWKWNVSFNHLPSDQERGCSYKIRMHIGWNAQAAE